MKALAISLRKINSNATQVELEYIYLMLRIAELENKIDIRRYKTILTNGLNEVLCDEYKKSKERIAQIKPNWQVIFDFMEKADESFFA